MLNPIENLIKTISQKLGTSPEKLKEAAQSGNISETLNNLDSKEAKEAAKILGNKEATDKLLSSPQAQEILKKIINK